MEKTKLVIGIDYGTDSCRALVVDTQSGEELASEVVWYPRWKAGLYCEPKKNQYRQHPLDYIESLEAVIKAVLAKCPSDAAERVVGLSFDTTGSTPVLLNEEGLPLAMLPEYAENPNAMFVLWKDHTALREADEINALAKEWEVDYTAYSGGVYSSEWVWSKMLHLLRADESVRKVAYSWTEHCDWMPALLTGKTKPEKMIRSRCAAGHKAMWNETWGGLPSTEFLLTLDPLLDLFTGHLYTDCYTTDTVVGTLSAHWSGRLGLSSQVVVSVGALDCHVGAVGAQITPGAFVRVMGTSTCDVMVASYQEMQGRLIEGICGQVDGSVVPGMVGLEAGQSAFGDVYAWYKQLLSWPMEQYISASSLLDEETKQVLMQEFTDSILANLTLDAERVDLKESTLIAVDWLNGRRTPVANQAVKGSIYGLTLGTTAPMLYRALVEATAFGSKAIVDSFLQQGVGIDKVIAIGGISQKSPFVMQTLADVLGMPILVAKAEQACALGAAMFAAVASGVYQSIDEAEQKLGKGFLCEYKPDFNKQTIYEDMYEKYLTLGAFTQNKIL
ncbi:L-ribulokinase [Parabacteroides sp. PF5-5]|uniref:ribulokinase n=1 Tax=unclassified Parabacteroides TaxID=2649774 RepID=UPI002476A2D6|nr:MULTISPECIES: ribulokinase [unclassified Parabacteroides]MDH6306565.1 L-ribulokinase [Parabacteroides sp. PH5-39]MDH6317532.1 L-ribulokinase [Parabacteroides sp. PF5-13]MDH6321276.1 L-ribulokinase [Parabacteroides sp. PH5-13]MDH6325008.1 L-ribulokinase [Parabacteroides sp. PH5-8]MDH6328717.1 L-ribulokinase [Parabacteroides sp. PH5-41]